MVTKYIYSNIIVLLSLSLCISVYADKVSEIHNHPHFKLLPKECGRSYPTDKVVGGKQAELGQFPWLVRLGYKLPGCKRKTMYRCGGSLITNKYVISAGHCVTDLPEARCPLNDHISRFVFINVVLGEYNALTNPDCVHAVCAEPVHVFLPKKVISHPHYNKPLYSNDISLIELNRPVEFNAWIAPICLPRGKQIINLYTNKRAEVAGWGTTDIRIPGGSNVPVSVKVPIISVNVCMHAFSKPLKLDKHRQMCAGGEENKDSCDGDSGAPLMRSENFQKRPRYFQVGIVSFGLQKCGKKNKPAIYTRIAGYMKWILDNMR